MKGLIPIFKEFTKKHATEILTVVASLGVIGTSVLTASATIKAKERIKDCVLFSDEKVYSLKDKIKICWKDYIPPVLSASATITCIVGIDILGHRALKDLSSAYVLLNSSYFTYKNKLKELYGEEAHNKIINEIVKEQPKPVYMGIEGICSFDHLYFDTNEPDITRTFFDGYSQRYFESTVAKVLEAEYFLNRNFMTKGAISLNEFYLYLGLEPVEGGDDIGWDIFYGTYWLDFSHTTTTLDDGMEIFVIDFTYGPEPFAYEQ